jgi:hypothetical protein
MSLFLWFYISLANNFFFTVIKYVLTLVKIFAISHYIRTDAWTIPNGILTLITWNGANHNFSHAHAFFYDYMIIRSWRRHIFRPKLVV